jgi:hypothetical protein
LLPLKVLSLKQLVPNLIPPNGYYRAHTNPLKFQYFDLRPMLTIHELVLEYFTLTKVVSNIKKKPLLKPFPTSCFFDIPKLISNVNIIVVGVRNMGMACA